MMDELPAFLFVDFVGLPEDCQVVSSGLYLSRSVEVWAKGFIFD
jgi:hypothetical protein